MGAEDLWGQRVGSPLQILPPATAVEIPTAFVPTTKNAPHQHLQGSNCVCRGVTIIPPHLIVNLQMLYEVLVRSIYHPFKIECTVLHNLRSRCFWMRMHVQCECLAFTF